MNTLAPPQDLDAEMAVIGCAFLSPATVAAAEEEGLRPEDFYRDGHRVLWDAVLTLEGAGEPIDVLTVRAWLEANGALEAAGGRAAVELASSAVPYASNVRGYAKAVRHQAVRRRRMEAAYRQIDRVLDDDEPGSTKRHATAAEEFVRWYEGPPGLPTPFEQLTRATGNGLQRGDYSVMSGWPAMGKSALIDQWLQTIHEAGYSCHMYLNEMDPGLRTGRTVARMTGVPWPTIRDKEMTAEQWARAFDVLQRLPAEFTDVTGWEVEDVVRDLRRNAWDFVLIDSASRIPRPRGMLGAEGIEYISGRLADGCRQSGTHALVVVQMNTTRTQQSGGWPVPTWRDLLGGGAWFRDARNIFFIHREQVKADVLGEEKHVAVKDAMVFADKATHGNAAESYVPVRFDAARMRYVERDAGGDVAAAREDAFRQDAIQAEAGF
jgi:replicative DNA helicase